MHQGDIGGGQGRVQTEIGPEAHTFIRVMKEGFGVHGLRLDWPIQIKREL